MTTWRTEASVLLSVVLLAHPRTHAQGAGDNQLCECPDVLDLVNRKNEAEAAIQFYKTQIAAWDAAGISPAATQSSRLAVKGQLQSAINAVTNHLANKADGLTDAACVTALNSAPTACLCEIIDQHEYVHRQACLSSKTLSDVFGRWSTLKDYAVEDIAAYGAELAYVKASLVNLQRECRFTLEFRSTIDDDVSATESKTNADVPLQSNVDYFAAPGLVGTASATYTSRDTGPPKLTGDASLVRLAKKAGWPCYSTWEGSGQLPIESIMGVLYRENHPPYAPLLELQLKIGTSRETFNIKGKKCPPSPPFFGSFWTDRFLMSKDRGAPDVIVLGNWQFSPPSGAFAEKTIISDCLAPGQKATVNPLTGTPVFLCSEQTMLTLKKRQP